MFNTCSLLLLLVVVASSFASSPPKLLALGTESLDSGAAMAGSVHTFSAHLVPLIVTNPFAVCSVGAMTGEVAKVHTPPPSPPNLLSLPSYSRAAPMFRLLIWTQASALVCPHALVCFPAATLPQLALYAVRLRP